MIEKRIREIIGEMTLEDKIKLCSGASFWASEQMEQYGIPSFFMSDGPHGLRTQKGESDHLGINNSEQSTCFPAACASGSSWNPDLLRRMGEAIAEEALAYEVDVVLGPGVNIKRNPLCGRNFEYFSEDPYLAGQMAKSWIQGVQSKGIGTSLKHFAGNNQEKERLLSDSLIDERALREIYLSAFEEAVKGSHPQTVMCSYNKINGTYASDNKRLLTDILRDEWGFDGMVMTDWGAMNDRVQAFHAGCDLEMPSSNGLFDAEVKEAVETEHLSGEELNASVERILRVAFQAAETRKKNLKENTGKQAAFDIDAHHKLAEQISCESAVLLKNDDHILPLKREEKIALCGAMAKNVRYQGAGSSHINPTRLVSVLDAVEQRGKEAAYYPAYRASGEADKELLVQAVKGAKNADKVIIFAGLPDAYESEGYDRTHMSLPDSHNELIEQIAAVHDDVIVVLMCGSPVEMPWIDKVKAVLHMYLGGQAVGEAVVKLLCGENNPSGKLAETYPVVYEDCSSSESFGTDARQVEYAESIYVGYRYYDKAGIRVQFPFGHGLSYTEFAYSDLELSSYEFHGDKELQVSVKVKNIGSCSGAEVVQLYVADQRKDCFKAQKELKGFEKVELKQGETKEVIFKLNTRSFAYFDVGTNDWEVQNGVYDILIGASSRDIRLQGSVQVEGNTDRFSYKHVPKWYRKPERKPVRSEFEMIYGKKIDSYQVEKPGGYTMLNTFNDMKENPVIAQIMKGMKAPIIAAAGGNEQDPGVVFTLSIIFNTPLIRLVQQGGGATPRELMELAVASANGSTEAMEQLGVLMSEMQ